MRHASRIACRALALVALAPAAFAAPPPLLDRVRVAAGPFLAQSTLRVGVAPDPAVVPEPVPSGPAEATLRETGNAMRWDLGVTWGQRHTLRLGGFQVDGEAEGSATRLLEDEGREVVVDASARGELELEVHTASWSLWTDEHAGQVFGAGLGVVRYALRTRVEGTIMVDGGPPGSGEARYAVDATAPMLRLDYRRRLAPAWRLGVEWAWVRKPRGSLSGDATEAAVGIEWLPHPHFGLALRYAVADLDLRYEREAGTATLEIRNHGPQLLAAWRW